jgi:hypothetical protein
MAGATQLIPAQIVYQNEYDVGRGLSLGTVSLRRTERSQDDKYDRGCHRIISFHFDRTPSWKFIQADSAVSASA